MLKPIIFIAASAGLAYLSRASLLVPRSHGFYRFFAWEFLLVLVLLNAGHWFRDPLSPRQIVAWLLLFISLLLVVHGVYLLRLVGKPDNRRSEEPLLGFEQTTALVTEGAYKYIRHPLYSSLLFLDWGVFFKNPSWLGEGLAAVATFFLTATAKVEETENTRFFGAAYQEYMKQTRMFIPFLF